MDGLKDSALIHFIDLEITPPPPFRFIFLEVYKMIRYSSVGLC